MKTSQKLRIAALFVLLFSSVHSISQAFSGLESTTLAPVSSTAGQWGLKIVVFDVGQADAILLLAPNGDVVVIDTGNNYATAKKIANYLGNACINGVGKLETINLLYSTHYDSDHIRGLRRLADYGIGIQKAFDQGPSGKRVKFTIDGKPIFREVYAKYLEAVGDLDGDNEQDADEPKFIRHKIEYRDTQSIGSSSNVEILCVSVRGDTKGDEV